MSIRRFNSQPPGFPFDDGEADRERGRQVANRLNLARMNAELAAAPRDGSNGHCEICSAPRPTGYNDPTCMARECRDAYVARRISRGKSE